LLLIHSKPIKPNNPAKYGVRLFKSPGGAKTATCPLPEVFTVMVTVPVCVTVEGVNIAWELGGSPPVLKVTAPAFEVRLAVKLNVPDVPAVTATDPFVVGVIVSGVIVVESLALLCAGFESEIPVRVAVLMITGGTKLDKFTVNVIGG
jgi:hypothetical protein